MKHFFVLLLVVTLAGCTETKHSVIKTDDELTAKIHLLFDKYVDNDFNVSEFYAEDIVCKINNMEFKGYENLISGFQAHHNFLYEDINIKERYVHTNYFSNGEIWSNAWFTWIGTGKTTGNDYSNRGHFDYKWEDGKIVELLAYYSETVENTESAAFEASQNN